jgi:hypothetical protein
MPIPPLMHSVASPRLALRRCARLVDRLRWNAIRNAGAMTDLPARIGTASGLPSVADPHVVNVVGRQSRALDRRARRDRAQLRGMEIAKRSAVLANRRACSAKDDDVTVRHNTPF